MGTEMNELLIEQLRARFAGHEAPVPQEAWPWISGKMAALGDGDMQGSLQEKFNGHAVEPDASAWANIAASLKQPAAGGHFPYGWVAAGVAALGLAGFLLWNAGEPTRPESKPVAQATAPATALPMPTAEATPAPQASSVTEPGNAGAMPVAAAPRADQGAVKAAPAVEVPQTLAPPEATVDRVEETRPTDLERPMQRPSPKQVPVQVTERQSEQGIAKNAVEEPAVANVPTRREQTEEAGAETTGEQTEAAIGEAFSLYIPTAFTVNADGLNDRLRIVADHYAGVDVRIATISGALVFHTNDLARMWDGRMLDGTLAAEGPYHCLVALTDLEGRTHFKREVIRLIR